MPISQPKPQLKPLIEPRWCDPVFHTADNQPALLPRIRAARAARSAQIEQEHLRRALYAACERAPLGWEIAR